MLEKFLLLLRDMLMKGTQTLMRIIQTTMMIAMTIIPIFTLAQMRIVTLLMITAMAIESIIHLKKTMYSRRQARLGLLGANATGTVLRPMTIHL